MLKAIFRHPSGRIGGGIVILFLILALLGALGVTPHDPIAQNRVMRLKPPSAEFWFGTDMFGRDIFSRLMRGLSTSFTISFASVGVAAVLGTLMNM